MILPLAVTLDQDSWTALHFAAQNNLCEVADILLEHGAAVNATDKVRNACHCSDLPFHQAS